MTSRPYVLAVARRTVTSLETDRNPRMETDLTRSEVPGFVHHHPFGMTGVGLAGHLLLEGRRRKARWGVVSMCVAGGMGAAGLFEIY